MSEKPDHTLATWDEITGKPSTFTPATHKTSHAAGGSDEISVASLLGQLIDDQPSSWSLVSGKPTTFDPAAHKTSHEAGGSDELLAASYVNRWTRPGRLYASNGTTLKQMWHMYFTRQAVAEIGDRLQMFFICAGTETIFIISTLSAANCGTWDLYVNGVLDSTGYEDYSQLGPYIHRYITLTQPIIAGLNRITLRVNSKHASSTGYYTNVAGASLQ